MQKVRFLIPFLVFLVLFLMTAGFSYYFFNEKQQIVDRIQAVENTIGTKFPVLSGVSAEEGFGQLSIKSSLYIRTVNLRKKIELIENKIGFDIADAGKIPAQISGEGDSKPSASAKTVTERMKKSPPSRIDYMKDIESIHKWLLGQQSLLKKFNNIKSQHFIDYSPFIGFDVQTQIAKANSLIANLKNPDISDAISAFALFYSESQDVDKESSRWKHIEAINAHVNSTTYKDDALALVAHIESAMSKYASFVNKSGLKISDLHESREIIFEAYANCVKLVRTLSTMKTTIDGEEKTLILPKITESKARNEASELLVLLHPNDNAFFKRVYDEGIIQPGVNLPKDEFSVANLEFSALIADSMSTLNARRFRTNPAFQAEIDLEKIIDAQSLTIDTLVEMNKMLKTKLLQVYETKKGKEGDPDVPLPSQPMVMKKMHETEIKKTNDNATLDIENRKKALESRTDNANEKRDLMLREVSNMSELADNLKEKMSKLSIPIKKAIAEHKERLKSLEKQFVSLKGIIAEDIKSEGKLRPSQGADGVITFTDRLNRSYNIDLGKADKIVPGMRFIVYNEVGGYMNVKGLIEVLNLRQNHYANCGLIIKYPGTEILKGDKISNPFFRKVNGKAEFLSVAFIGKFEPPESNISNAQLKTYLTELGVKVIDEPTSSTDLIILSKPISKLEHRTWSEKHYIEELRPKIRFDELEVKDILLYFHDQ